MSLRVSFLIAAMAGALPAQIPGHATQLNPTSGTYYPTMVRVGDTIHACGAAEVGGSGRLDWTLYARSDDGGRTWPVREMPLATAGLFVDIAAVGDLVVVLVNSQYFGPHTVTSTDGGQSFSLPVRVSQQSGFNDLNGAGLYVDGTTVSVCWFENRPNGWLWFNQSTDGGFTWRPTDQQIDIGVTPGLLPMYWNRLHFAGDGNVLNIVWDPQGIPAGGIYHQRSVDGGATWLPAAQNLGVGYLGNFAADGRALFFVESIGVVPTLWRSIDGGATWGTVTNHGLQRPSGVAVERSLVIVSGTHGPQLFTGEASVSLDFGQTWIATPSVVSSSRDFFAAPQVAGGEFYLYGFYTDFVQPTGFVMHTGPTGTQWRQLAGDAGAGLFAWPEGCIAHVRPPGPASTDVYAYVLVGHSGVGTGTPGVGGITPELTGTGIPLLGRAFTYDVANARASAPGVLGVSLSSPTSVPLGSATLYLQPPVIPFVFTTSSVGSAALPVAIPSVAVFAGVTFVSQALVLDSNAASGFSATRAVETRIQ